MFSPVLFVAFGSFVLYIVLDVSRYHLTSDSV